MPFTLSSCNVVITYIWISVTLLPARLCFANMKTDRNPRDPYAVALWKDNVTVCHVPRAILCIYTLFLKRGDMLVGKPSLLFRRG